MFDTDLNEKETWKNASSVLKENVWKYYVYDILVKYWSDGGTNKIHTSNNEKRYLLPLTRGMFSVAFDNYVEYCNNIEEKLSHPSKIIKCPLLKCPECGERMGKRKLIITTTHCRNCGQRMKIAMVLEDEDFLLKPSNFNGGEISLAKKLGANINFK